LLIGAAFKDSDGKWLMVTKQMAYYHFMIKSCEVSKSWK
jgi:hypothetical protein